MPEYRENLKIYLTFLGDNRGETYNTYTGVNVKVFLILLSLLSVSNTSLADIGETTHDFMPDEFLMKAYIKAHEAVVSDRVNSFNSNGKKSVMNNLDDTSKALMNSLFKKSGVHKFSKVVKNDHYYSLKVETIKISFSTADLILDRIYVDGEIFEINRREDLTQLQTRLKSFLVKSRTKKKTSFIDYLIPQAHAQFYNRDHIEDMVVLNASGVISITYPVKGNQKISEYAIDLANALTNELNGAFEECSRKSQQLSDISFRRMDDSMKSIVDSMKTEGKMDRSKLISSLMKKFAIKAPVDAESVNDKGSYKPISGSCSNFDNKNPGVIQQMFPTMTRNPVDPSKNYDSWLTGNSLLGTEVNAKRGVCDAIDRTVNCLEGLEGIETNNIANQTTGDVQKIKFSRRSVFDEVNGSKGNSK